MTSHPSHAEVSSERGFTLVEVLVVVIIVGVLAAVAVPVFMGQRDKAAGSVTRQHMRNSVNAIFLARENRQGSLLMVTGNNCSNCACRNLANPLPVRDPGFPATSCGANWRNLVDKVAAASGSPVVTVERLFTDGWGYPILPDENENESGHGGCAGVAPDVLVSGGKDHVHSAGGDDIVFTLPKGGFCV